MHLPSKYTLIGCLLQITLGVYSYSSSDHKMKENPTKHTKSYKNVVVQRSEYSYTKKTEHLMSDNNFINENLLGLDNSPEMDINIENHRGAVTSPQPENCSDGKKGDCPSSEGIIGTCEFDEKINCLSQNECPEGYKCCRYGCGSICRAVAEHLNHPGHCPATGKACNTDALCEANEKCCNGHCLVVRRSSVPVIEPHQ